MQPCPALFLWLFLVGSPGKLLATVISSPESSAARAIAASCGHYSEQHQGRLPEKWSDLEGTFSLPLEYVFPYVAPEKRYAFLSPPLPLIAPHEGVAFAIHRSDIYDISFDSPFWGTGLKGPGRYVLCKTSEGDFGAVWVSAEYVKALFAHHKIVPPAPDAEPERQWVIRARNAKYK